MSACRQLHPRECLGVILVAAALALWSAGDAQEAHAAVITSPVNGSIHYATSIHLSVTGTSGDPFAVFEWQGEIIQGSHTTYPGQGSTTQSSTADNVKPGTYKIWVSEYNSASIEFRSQNVTFEVRDPSREPVITSPTEGGIYHQNEPITFSGTVPSGHEYYWTVAEDDRYNSFANTVVHRLPVGTYTLTLNTVSQSVITDDRASVTFQVILPPGNFNATGPILLDWWTSGDACFDDLRYVSPNVARLGYFSCDRQNAEPTSVTRDSNGRITDVACPAGSHRLQSNAVHEDRSYRCYVDKWFHGQFHWQLSGLTCPEGTDRDCYGSQNAQRTFPITCDGTIVGLNAVYTQKPEGFVTYECRDLDGHSDFVTREIKFKDSRQYA